jgi:ABC-type transporter Mla subunit MlaD
VFSKVTTNQDVERHRNYLVNTLKTYKSISPLVQDDIKDVETAMARYEIAVNKVIQTYNNVYTDFNFTAEELNNLINDVIVQHENVNKLLMRKLFQD